MAHILADRVRQFSTTSGTGNITVASSVASYRSFSSVLSVNDTFYYTIAHLDSDEWEVGIGTYVSLNVFSRDTIISSSNSGSAVNFSAGDKDVFITAPSISLLTTDNIQNVLNKTLIDPVIKLQANDGITGQVAISQGTGVPPVWHTLVPADLGAITLGTDTTGNYVGSVATTAPLAGGAAGSEGGVLTLSLATAYGDTQNPYASKTANFVLAAPSGAAGVPTFRAITVADIPTLNQNTTGSAATLTTGRTISLTGDVTGTSGTFDGSGNLSFATTIAANSVALGTDTTGNYVASMTAGTGITVGTATGEGSTPVITNTAPNVTTNLSTTTSATTLTVVSSDGTNAVLPAATTTVAGVLTGADKLKLDGIETGATADQTATEILTAIKTVDGTGSGLDADLLDEQEGSYYLDWTNTTNKPDPVVTVTLTGDVTGTANTTLTDLASGTVSVATTIAANSVALGTDTTGNYVASMTAGTGITVGTATGEGSTPVITNTAPNVTTNLSTTTAATTVTINSSDGTNATIPAATTTVAGVLTGADKTKLDGIETGAQVNVATNLGYTTAATTGTVTSSTGTNATLPAATTSLAGLLTGADKLKLDGIATGATTNTGTVTLVANGNGMNFTDITTTGTVTLGTPSTLTAATTNAVTASSHTHEITGFATTSHAHYIGTTAVQSSSANQAVTGITSLTGGTSSTDMTITTADVASASSGILYVETGNVTAGNASSGSIGLRSGDGFGTGGSGSVSVYAGNSGTTATSSGNVNVQGGSTTGTTTVTGGKAILWGGSTTAVTTTSSTGGSAYVHGGRTYNTSGTKQGGHVYIEGGNDAVTQGYAATAGIVYVGANASGYGGTGTSAVNIGSSANTTTVNGTVKLPNVGTSGFVKLGAGGQLSADTNTYSTTSHNHTTLTGITSLGFAAEASDSASISTTINASGTYFDFNLTDDNNNDWWRWRFTPSGSTVYDAMTLKPVSNGLANLTVSGTVSGSNLSGTNTGDNPGVTSVATSGGYGGLTLTGGTITSTGTITMGGTPTGTWPISISGEAATITSQANSATIASTSASTVSTIVQRDSSGDINARLFRSEYDTTNSTIGYIMTQIDTVSNNYIRPSTVAQVAAALNLSGTNTGDNPGVTAVNNGNGMNFTNITTTGTVTLGTPSTCTNATTNAVTASSHTHAITGFLTAESDTLATVTSRGNVATSHLIIPSGEGNAVGFWGGSTGYSIAMGVTAGTYQYGPVYDYSIKTCMAGGAGRGFTWGANGVKPIAALNATSGDMTIAGAFSAASKSFLIKHPTKPDMQLRHGSLEGPEHGVYVRGKLKGNVIELPEYWTKLVDPDSITVQLTAIGKHQKLYVKDIVNNTVIVGNDGLFAGEVNCFYFVQAERIDVAKLEVEVD